METVSIRRIAVDRAGRVRVTPDLPDRAEGYEWIYRAALSVRWDDATRELYVLPVPYLTALDEYRLILRAAREEYGHNLVIASGYAFDHVTPELEAAFRGAGSDPPAKAQGS
jgi:hypothetical protein